MTPEQGHYLGTEIGGRWYRRAWSGGLFVKGMGTWWIEDGALCFLRLLTSEPLKIPLAAVTSVTIGSWHCGSWYQSPRVLKLTWDRAGETLTSGFILKLKTRRVTSIATFLQEQVAAVRKDSHG